MDDVVIKTRSNDQFIADLQETFENLRRFKWKLNPTKCVFGVPAGKLLGFIVSSRGIEAYPTKINIIRFMKPPRYKKNLMKLPGCMAALSRFISRLGDKGLAFFKILKKSNKFEWNEEAAIAIQQLKDFLTTLTITAPEDGETLLLYITATTHVVSIAWSSNETSQAMFTRYNDPFTSSVKYSASPSCATPRSRNPST